MKLPKKITPNTCDLLKALSRDHGGEMFQKGDQPYLEAITNNVRTDENTLVNAKMIRQEKIGF